MFYVLNLIVCRPDLCDINYVVNSKKLCVIIPHDDCSNFVWLLRTNINVNYIQELMRIFNFISKLSLEHVKGSVLFLIH